MSTLQKQVIQSLNGLSDDNLQFLLEIIQRFMKPAKEQDKNGNPSVSKGNEAQRIGGLEGQDLIDGDYDIDACNDEIAELFGILK